jgi:hypothetical protein
MRASAFSSIFFFILAGVCIVARGDMTYIDGFNIGIGVGYFIVALTEQRMEREIQRLIEQLERKMQV